MKMSESRYPGFKDLQDEEIKYLLSESGYPRLKDLQDKEIKYFQ
jgi:hypothetical protein